jgi:hypothetical protein
MAQKLTYGCSTDYLKHRDKILDLPKREYGRVSSDLYDSLYSGNPYGEPLLGLCFDKDKLIGQENYIRHDIACRGTIYNGALGINTLVDSRYRLFHGVFGKLGKLTIDEMKPRVDVLCAFANEESKKYYLKYFQWKDASKVQVYKKATKYSGLNRESILSFILSNMLTTRTAFISTRHRNSSTGSSLTTNITMLPDIISSIMTKYVVIVLPGMTASKKKL